MQNKKNKKTNVNKTDQQEQQNRSVSEGKREEEMWLKNVRCLMPK